MNAAVRSLVKYLYYSPNVTVLAVKNGIDGLCSRLIEPIFYTDVNGWTGMGGANLGARRTLPEGKFQRVAEVLREFNVHGLIAIGGFQAYHALGQLYEQRDKFAEFCVPMIVVPATCSNNVPGTEVSLGSDTALNQTIDVIDRLRMSAKGTGSRMFVVETGGGNCGYLASLSGLAGGADSVYIPEEKFTVHDLLNDVRCINAKMQDGVTRGLVVISDLANQNYDSGFLNKLYAEEGKDFFSCKKSVIGFIQQGHSASPFDRSLGLMLGHMTADWLLNKARLSFQVTGKVFTRECDSAVLLGLSKRQYVFSPLKSLIPETDFEKRTIKNPSRQWWIKLNLLNRIIVKHTTVNEEEGIFVSLKTEPVNL